jgi:hypothetical protein
MATRASFHGGVASTNQGGGGSGGNGGAGNGTGAKGGDGGDGGDGKSAGTAGNAGTYTQRPAPGGPGGPGVYGQHRRARRRRGMGDNPTEGGTPEGERARLARKATPAESTESAGTGHSRWAGIVVSTPSTAAPSVRPMM